MTLPFAGPIAGPATRPGTPLWRHIADTLRQEIADHPIPPATRLPSEAQLAARFGVNRHTVRRAIEELSRDGLVRVEQGRGVFVAEDVLDYAVEPRTRFSAWIRRHDKEPSGRVLRCWTHPADRAVAQGLGIGEGDRVATLERLGLADGRPVSLGLHHFSEDRLPGIAAALAAESSITAALQRVGVADYMRQSTRVSARLPTEAEAALLQTARNRPLLICDNLNVDMTGRVVEFGHSRYPTPRVQMVFEP